MFAIHLRDNQNLERRSTLSNPLERIAHTNTARCHANVIVMPQSRGISDGYRNPPACAQHDARASREPDHNRQQVLEDRQLSQADAAKVPGVTQPKASALRHYKLAGFSVERLMNLLTALDRDVESVIRRKPRSRKAGRITI